MAYVPPTVTTHQAQFYVAGSPVVLQGINQQSGQTGGVVTKLGAKFVRIWVRWSDIEPQPRVWNSTALDKLDSQVQAYSQQGVQVLIDFHSTARRPPPAWTQYQSRPDWFAWSSSKWMYLRFVRLMVLRYQAYANVIGWELWNEPQGLPATRAGTALIIRWQNFFINRIRQWDRRRAIVVQLRTGWDMGLTHADLSGFTQTSHLVLDFHDNWSGTQAGTGFTRSGEAVTADACRATAPCSIPYQGTLGSQLRHLSYALQWRTRLDRPVLIGEWDGLPDDPNISILQSQLLTAFARRGLSWARWQGRDQPLCGNLPDGLNPAGEQLKETLGVSN